jgi:hypothetical protein
MINAAPFCSTRIIFRIQTRAPNLEMSYKESLVVILGAHVLYEKKNKNNHTNVKVLVMIMMHTNPYLY